MKRMKVTWKHIDMLCKCGNTWQNKVKPSKTFTSDLLSQGTTSSGDQILYLALAIYARHLLNKPGKQQTFSWHP
jgi:hypothetical protein